MLRGDLDIVRRWITPGSRVLDLGCGDGTLLDVLKGSHHIEGYGIEIDAEKITQCIARGINVIEADLDLGLTDFPDKSFDTVLMTNSLQALRRPDRTIAEMLRIGRECVVTFPNFGNIRTRLSLVSKGRMPVTRQLPYEWYDTPNIHFCTVSDFEDLCRQLDTRILNRQFVTDQFPDRYLRGVWPNLFCATAIYHLASG
jgi:methionine biosynthesis protein MetW